MDIPSGLSPRFHQGNNISHHRNLTPTLPEAYQLARLAFHLPSRVLLSLPPEVLIAGHMLTHPAFSKIWGSKLMSSCKHFTHWAISQTQKDFSQSWLYRIELSMHLLTNHYILEKQHPHQLIWFKHPILRKTVFYTMHLPWGYKRNCSWTEICILPLAKIG